ncbi:hypothetical protein [Bradyrhizobium sp. CB3481]|uniref:hypothetical protein n=1 Tax=Bradyrhizobium sp. CB3481 TaxID=3039158 RepID=UPI0024B1F62C|nr:hypothetical protein [Bradyrhizobium sp. CB3481]WFU13752.1 hypothetical protein QA643_21165 [Bradyrhizobium sp. CB3481]
MASRRLTADDAPKIAAAIPQLARIGLRPLFPEEEFPALARRIAEEFAGTGIPDPPLPLTWFDLALTGPEQVFANAVHFQDHCFDVAGEEDYAGVVASIMALAGEEWPNATVSASSVQRLGQYGLSHRIEIVIQGEGGAPSFDLIADKDFDWSVVTRLNERLPPGAAGRFAAFFDGDATIVYLKPEQIAELGKLFGSEFATEVEPLQERPPLHGSRETADAGSARPLPLWALAVGVPIGLFAASQLVAMILRGAPYTISGSTRVAFAAAPLEFLFLVAMYIGGVALFLGGPVYLTARKWRAPRQLPRRAT